MLRSPSTERLLDHLQYDSQQRPYSAAVPALLRAMLAYLNETFNSRHAYLDFRTGSHRVVEAGRK